MLLGAEVKLERKENKIRVLDPSFTEFYPPNTFPRYCKGSSDPPGYPTMLILSVLGHTNPKNTFNWL